MAIDNRPTGAGRRAPVRPPEPPFLFTAAPSHLGLGLVVTGDIGMTVVEVAVHGQWSARLGEQVSAAVRMCLAGPSPSIILNLRDLQDAYGVSLSFWLALWRHARLGDTPVDVAFCLPVTTALSRRLRFLQGPQPRVFPTVLEARIAIAKRESRADRFQARLEPRPASIEAARALLTRACDAWHLQELRHDAWSIVSELAANAVEHARTDLVVTVSRSSPRLHVAIHDCVSRFPRPGKPEVISAQSSLDERGRGLRLVHSIAAAWGAMPTRDGKVVWATVTGPTS